MKRVFPKSSHPLFSLRRLHVETLEDRRLLAAINLVSGSVGGRASVNGSSEAVRETNANEYYAEVVVPGDSDGSRGGQTFLRASISPDGGNDRVSFEIDSSVGSGSGQDNAGSSYSINTTTPIVFEVASTHPFEQPGDRVLLELSSIVSGSITRGPNSNGNATLSVSVEISVDGELVQSFQDTASIDNLVLEVTEPFVVEAAIGDKIRVTTSFTGNANDRGDSVGVTGGLDFDVDFAPYVDLVFPSAGMFNPKNNTFDFPYRILNENSPAAAEIALYWAQDLQFGYDPFDPEAGVFNPELTCGPATLNNYVMEHTSKNSPDDSHMVSIPLSEFTAAPPDAEGLQLVMDPDDVVAQSVEETLGFVNFHPASIRSFSHAAGNKVDRLAIEYEPTPGGEFDIQFVTVADRDYEAMGYRLNNLDGFLDVLADFGEPIDYEVIVAPDAISANPAWELEGESASQANFPSVHRLLIDPKGTELETALLDPDNEAVVAIVDFGEGCSGFPNIQGAPFSGFYHNGSTDRAVVRSRFGTEDEVTVSGTTVTVPNLFGDKSATFSGSPEDILIITSDRDDTVQTTAGTTVPLYVRTGPGSDTIVGGDGNDILNGSYGDDLSIQGGGGDDVVIGGPGSDGKSGGLTGGNGHDVILGDGFTLVGGDFDSVVEALKEFPSKVELPLSLTPISGGDDTIEGGEGNELIIGGDGSDTIDANAGHAIIFGDAFEVTSQIDLTTSDIWTDFNDAVDFMASATLQGNGGDIIKSGSDSSSVVIGGAGNDTIEGGTGILDMLFGGEGEDVIRGAESDKLIKDKGNLIVGGNGNDKELRGGDGPNLIFGDDFELNIDLDFDLGALLQVDSEASALKVSGARFELTGDGNDKIYGGNGPLDVLFGGDGDDEIDAGMGHAIIFGDAFVIDAEIDLPTNGLWTELNTANDFLAEATLLGNGNDVIKAGTDSSSLVLGGGGNDTIEGGSGLLDLLFGNDGDDTVRGIATDRLADDKANLIVGGNGNDKELRGGDGPNLIFGDSFKIDANLNFDLEKLLQGKDGDGKLSSIFKISGAKFELIGNGNDTIHGGNGVIDVLIGGDGMDRILGNDGFNVAFGDDFSFASDTTEVLFDIAKDLFDLAKDLSTANPFTFVGNIADLVTSVYKLFVGAEGNSGGAADFYLGGKDTDIVFGGDGDDQLLGEKRGTKENGSDFLVGGNGNDTFVTGPNAEIQTQGDNKIFDFAFGGQGDDVFIGSGDNDFLGSSLGDDIFFGGDGNDLLAGGDAGDQLYGQDGDDTLLGDGGNNFIAGGSGDDELYGGADDDVIYGGTGTDVIEAGAGINQVFADRLVADFNNDGDVDGSDFLIWKQHAGLTEGSTIEQGDANADGAVDARDLSIWRSATQRSFVDISQPEISGSDSIFVPRELELSIDVDLQAFEVGDIDGDGDLDLIGSTSDSTILFTQENIGEPYDPREIGDFALANLRLADLDGDATLELVGLRSTPIGFDVVVLNDLSETTVELDVVASIEDATVSHIMVTDFDNDGELDIIASRSALLTHTNFIWLKNEGTTFTEIPVVTNNDGIDPMLADGESDLVKREVTIDFDLDGDLDVIMIRAGGVHWLENRLTGDLNGDNEVGFADFLLLSSQFGRDVEIWAVGDLNGDGKVSFADFLLLSANFGAKRNLNS